MSRVGPYELLEELGSGGFGRVYRARHTELGVIRAVKVATDPEFVRQLRREGEVLARLRHPRIVEVYDMNTSHHPPYVVMEYVEGGDLRTLLERDPLPVEQAVQIMLDVLDALEHAHGQGVIHRDIKPSNILLDKDGRAKVSDFGLGRIVEDISKSWARVDSVRSGSGDNAGTLKYMSPEQLEPAVLKGEAIDHRTDLYSLGLVLYEMLTGELPLGTAPEPPSEVRRGVAAELDEVFGKLTQGRRERRYPSAQETASALRAARDAAESKRKMQEEAERQRRIAADNAAAQRCLDEGRYAQAIAAWRAVLELSSGDASAAAGIETALARQREAEERARPEEEEEQRKRQVARLLAEAQGQFDQAQVEEARATWQRVLGLDPDNAAAQNGIAAVKEREKRAKAEAAKRSRVAGLVAAAQRLSDSGQIAAAISSLREVVRLDPQNSAARPRLAELLEEERAAAEVALRQKRLTQMKIAAFVIAVVVLSVLAGLRRDHSSRSAPSQVDPGRTKAPLSEPTKPHAPAARTVIKHWDRKISCQTRTETRGSGPNIRRRLAQAGVNGLVRVAVKVTYDAAGRKVASQEIGRQWVRKPLDRVEVVERYGSAAPQTGQLPKRMTINDSVRPVAGKWYYGAGKISMGGRLFEGSGSSVGQLDTPSFATFDVRGWDRFTGYAGVDDNQPSKVVVRLTIEVDEQPIQEVRLEKGQVPAKLDVSLSGHRTLTIRRNEVTTSDGLSVVWSKYSEYSIAQPTLSK